jgi:hypothetical protein
MRGEHGEGEEKHGRPPTPRGRGAQLPFRSSAANAAVTTPRESARNRSTASSLVTSLRIHQWHSILELDAYEGRWRLRQSLSRRYAGDSRQLWSAPATTGVWTRCFFKVRYSTHPKKVFIRMGVDLNGDGDFADSGELIPRFRPYTLKVRDRPGWPRGQARPCDPFPSPSWAVPRLVGPLPPTVRLLGRHRQRAGSSSLTVFSSVC